MRQSPHNRVPHLPLATASAAPPVVIGIDNPAFDDRPGRFDPLTGSDQTKVIKPAERGQVGRVEGSVRHVEVFRTAV
jgi:hypothetical protein